MTERAFTGQSYIDIKFETLGVMMKRFVSVTYSYTPRWPYYDQRLKREVYGEQGIDLEVEVLAGRPPRRSLDERRAASAPGSSVSAIWPRYCCTLAGRSRNSHR